MSALPPEGRDGSDTGPIHVPDDISALEPDIVALRRERAAAARRERLRRLARAPRWVRFGIAVPLIVGVLAVAAVSGAWLSVEGNRVAPAGTLAPPLASPGVAAGTVGGLLPEATLDVGGAAEYTAELRPAVIALVPASCTGCVASARDLLQQVSALQGQVLFVSAGSAVSAAADRLGTLLPAATSEATYPHGVLAAAYHPAVNQLTVLLVRSDGVVTAVLRGFGGGMHLEAGFSLAGS